MVRRSCGKKLSSRRIVLVVKMVIFEKCEKVFDNGLGQQMISNCHETPQGEMTHIIRAFHQFGAYLGKVANATFVNPRN